MNQQLNQLFQAKKRAHFARDYTYFDDSEINSLSSPNSFENTCFLLPHLSVIKVSGEDALSFLQGQITVDLNNAPLAPMACYMSRKGRIISLFYLARDNNDFYLMMPSDISDVFIKQLKKYVFMSKVSIDITDRLVISLTNDLSKMFNSTFLKNEPHTCIENQTWYALDETQLSALHDANTKKPFTLMGDWAWHKQQLLNKTTSIYPETIAKLLAHDIELHTTSAIDFKKGCYIGQEIVARMHYKAKLNYELNVISIGNEVDAVPGSDLIIDDVKKGMVVDALSDTQGNQLVLLCLRKKHNEK